MKKIIALISAISLVGALFVAPTQAAVGDSFTVQAEEVSAYTLKGTAMTGIPTQGDCGGVADFTKYYSASAERPAFGETGNGIMVASWGTYVYALTLRPAGGGIDSLTYTVNAPCAGTYDMDIYAGNWDNVKLSVSVNGAAAVTSDFLTKNLSGYSLSADNKDTNFVKDGTISLDLKAGSNTIVVTASKSIYLDKYVFTCTQKAAPEGLTKSAEILTEAEETSAFTAKGDAKEGIPTIEGIGSAADYPNYYSNGNAQATSGESGKGIAINPYAKAYSVTLRPANKGLDSLTYKVTAPFAGTYKLSMRTGLFATTYPKVVVNGTATTITSLQINITSGYTAAFVWNENVAEIELEEGENTITFTPGSQPFYFDCFKLVVDPTYELCDYGTIKKDEVAEGAFYSVRVAEVNDELTLSVEDKDFTITGLGSFDVDTTLTYAILGYTTPSTDITISSGETVYKAE